MEPDQLWATDEFSERTYEWITIATHGTRRQAEWYCSMMERRNRGILFRVKQLGDAFEERVEPIRQRGFWP